MNQIFFVYWWDRDPIARTHVNQVVRSLFPKIIIAWCMLEESLHAYNYFIYGCGENIKWTKC